MIFNNEPANDHRQVAARAKDVQLLAAVDRLGIGGAPLEEMMALDLNEHNINEHGRFDRLKDSVDKERAKAFFEEREGSALPLFKVNMRAADLLRRFVLDGGFGIDG